MAPVEPPYPFIQHSIRATSPYLQVWLRAVGAELGEGGGGSAAAQKVLERALNALPSRKHIKVRCFFLCLARWKAVNTYPGESEQFRCMLQALAVI